MDCAVEAQASNIAQMVTHSGPNMVRWRARLTKAAERISPPPTLDVADAARQASVRSDA